MRTGSIDRKRGTAVLPWGATTPFEVTLVARIVQQYPPGYVRALSGAWGTVTLMRKRTALDEGLITSLRSGSSPDSASTASVSRTGRVGPLTPDTVARLQASAGNAAVQRVLAAQRKAEPKSTGDQDKLESEEQKEPAPVSVQCQLEVQRVDPQTVVAPGVVVQRATPISFPLTTSEARSNTDPATTSAEDPTFTASVTKNDKKKRWGYKLDSVEAKGKIKYVYYTEDHYPAPTPNDDSGALTNVDAGNWKAIVKDLIKHRTKVAGDWSAYRRTQLHEGYHWKGEWQKLVKAGVKKAEKKFGQLRVSFADAATEADAEKKLKAEGDTAFTDIMAAVRRKWNALGDSAGDPPYRAGAPGADALAARVKGHAKTNKWK